MSSPSDLNKLILEVARGRFPDDNIVDVRVVSDVDADGEEILEVMVVFENDTGRLPGKPLLGFIRHVRDSLEERAKEDRFPVVSYIWSKELEKIAAGS